MSFVFPIDIACPFWKEDKLCSHTISSMSRIIILLLLPWEIIRICSTRYKNSKFLNAMCKVRKAKFVMFKSTFF